MNRQYFKQLTVNQEIEFRKHVPEFCKKGFSIQQLSIIHPTIRFELIRILKNSLKNTGFNELEIETILESSYVNYDVKGKIEK